MPEIRFGKASVMTLTEIAETFNVRSRDMIDSLTICENSGFHWPMRTLFPGIEPPGSNVRHRWRLSEAFEQQRYAKALGGIGELLLGFRVLRQGGRTRVFTNHTGEMVNTVFFERSGVACSAYVGSDGSIKVYKLFNHIDIKSPKLLTEVTILARYVRRFAA
jgi:hypothetical protein